MTAANEGYTYKLPDEQELTLDEDIVLMKDHLFSQEGRTNTNMMLNLINQSIQRNNENKYDCKVYDSIVLTGGNSCLSGFVENTKDVVKEITQHYSLTSKLFSFPNEAIRKNCCWIGGSIFGSIDKFHQFFISKQEFGEYGSSIIDRKLI